MDDLRWRKREAPLEAGEPVPGQAPPLRPPPQPVVPDPPEPFSKRIDGPPVAGQAARIEIVVHTFDKYVLWIVNRLVELYEAWGKPDEAAKYRSLLQNAESEPR